MGRIFSTSRDDAYVSEILERSRNMEKLLRHHVQGISLDTDNLRNLAEAIPESEVFLPPEMEGCSNSNGTTHHDPFNDTEDLTIDEKFTVQPLGHNATRVLAIYS